MSFYFHTEEYLANKGKGISIPQEELLESTTEIENDLRILTSTNKRKLRNSQKDCKRILIN